MTEIEEPQCPDCKSYEIVVLDHIDNEYERYDVVRCYECGKVFVYDCSQLEGSVKIKYISD